VGLIQVAFDSGLRDGRVFVECCQSESSNRASSKVERARLKRASCTNAMRSAKVVLPRAALAWKVGEGCCTSSSQSFVAGVH